MMRCYVCGRRLLRAAATVTTAEGTGYAGPACARRLGLLPARVRRLRTATKRTRKAVQSAQMELAAS